MQQDLPSCNNITTTTAPPMNQNQYHPASKPVARRPLPSLPSKLFKPSSTTLGVHGRDEHHVIKLLHHDDDHVAVVSSSSSSSSRDVGSSEDGGSNGGRERLKRHREDVAGRVVIPDKWGKEELLKDWMDYSSFDSLLAPTGLASARQALMAEGRRRTSSHQRLRIQSMC